MEGGMRGHGGAPENPSAGFRKTSPPTSSPPPSTPSKAKETKKKTKYESKQKKSGLTSTPPRRPRWQAS